MYAAESAGTVSGGNGGMWWSSTHDAAMDRLEAKRDAELTEAAANPTSVKKEEYEMLTSQLRGKTVEQLAGVHESHVSTVGTAPSPALVACERLVTKADRQRVAKHCAPASCAYTDLPDVASVLVYCQMCLQVWSVEDGVKSLCPRGTPATAPVAEGGTAETPTAVLAGAPTSTWFAKVTQLAAALTLPSMPPNALFALFASLELYPGDPKKSGKWDQALGKKSSTSPVRTLVEKLLSLAHGRFDNFLNTELSANPDDIVDNIGTIEQFLLLLDSLHGTPGIPASSLSATIVSFSNVVLSVKGSMEDSDMVRSRLGSLLLMVMRGGASSFDPWKVEELIAAVSWSLGDEAFKQQSVAQFAKKGAPSPESVCSVTKWFSTHFSAISKTAGTALDRTCSETPPPAAAAGAPVSPKTGPNEEEEPASPSSPLPPSKATSAADSSVTNLLSSHPYAFFSILVQALCTKDPLDPAQHVLSVPLTKNLHLKTERPQYTKDMFLLESLFYKRMSECLELVAQSLPSLGGDSVYDKVLSSVLENVLLVEMVDNCNIVELLLYGSHLNKAGASSNFGGSNFFTRFFTQRFNVQERVFDLFSSTKSFQDSTNPWASLGIFLPLMCFNGTDPNFFSACGIKNPDMALASQRAETKHFSELSLVTNPVWVSTGNPKTVVEEGDKAQKDLLANIQVPVIVTLMAQYLSEYWNRNDDVLIRETPQAVVSLVQVTFNGFLSLMTSDAEFAAKVQSKFDEGGLKNKRWYPAIVHSLENHSGVSAAKVAATAKIAEESSEVKKEEEEVKSEDDSAPAPAVSGKKKEDPKKQEVPRLIRHFWAHGPQDTTEVHSSLAAAVKSCSPLTHFHTVVEGKLTKIDKANEQRRESFKTSLKEITSSFTLKQGQEKSTPEHVDCATKLAAAIVHRSHLGAVESLYCAEYMHQLLLASYTHVYQCLATVLLSLRRTIPYNPILIAKGQLQLYVNLYKDFVRPLLTYGASREEKVFAPRIKLMTRFFFDNCGRHKTKNAWWEQWTVDASMMIDDCVKLNPPLAVIAKQTFISVVGTYARALRVLTFSEERLEKDKEKKELPWVKDLLKIHPEPYSKVHGVLESFGCFAEDREPPIPRRRRDDAPPRGAPNETGKKRDRDEAKATDVKGRDDRRCDDRAGRGNGRGDGGRDLGRDDRRDDRGRGRDDRWDDRRDDRGDRGRYDRDDDDRYYNARGGGDRGRGRQYDDDRDRRDGRDGRRDRRPRTPPRGRTPRGRTPVDRNRPRSPPTPPSPVNRPRTPPGRPGGDSRDDRNRGDRRYDDRRDNNRGTGGGGERERRRSGTPPSKKQRTETGRGDTAAKSSTQGGDRGGQDSGAKKTSESKPKDAGEKKLEQSATKSGPGSWDESKAPRGRGGNKSKESSALLPDGAALDVERGKRGRDGAADSSPKGGGGKGGDNRKGNDRRR